MDNEQAPMQRVAFQLRIRKGQEAAYDEAHRQVWPELLAKLREVGIRQYSIFRRGQQLFLYLQAPDFAAAQEQLRNDPVNLRWQAEMLKLFEPVPGLEAGEEFYMMQEVFHLEG